MSLKLTSLQKAAVTAGLFTLIMALTVPFVEFYIFPKLVDLQNPIKTVQNISQNLKLFSLAAFIHFTTVICDIVVAWALYLFLKPLNKNLALLTSLFRFVYTAFNIVALHNLIQILASLNLYGAHSNRGVINADFIMLNLFSFNLQWRFGLIFFGFYLLLLCLLLFKTPYVPKYISLCILIAGLGYVFENLKHFFYPELNTGFLWFTFFGELIFMLWLLIKGPRIILEKPNR